MSRASNRALVLVSLSVLLAAPVAAERTGPPPTPRDLQPWVEYARELVPPSDDCPVPGGQALCGGYQVLRVEGDPGQGRLVLSFEGENLARNPRVLPLVGSSETFTVERVLHSQPAGVRAPRVRLDLDAQRWDLKVAPGPFLLRCEVGFTPRASLPLVVPGPVAELQTRVSGGAVTFHEPGAWHGGVLLLQTGEDAEAREAPVTVRAVRTFAWGAVPTFSYRYTITGLKEQQELTLPLLGGERVEGVEPDRPFRHQDPDLQVTLPPGDRFVLTVRGHFAGPESRLAKPAGIPFEYWLFVTDVRHPVQLATTGREIDPGAIQGVEVPAGSRGFFLAAEQQLTVEAIPVEVDEGRGGSGEIAYLFVQGEGSHWVGTLDLAARVPRLDRLDVHTPPGTEAHYAERGGEAIRMFKGEGGALSVQLAEGGEAAVPVRVQWKEEQHLNPFAALAQFELPAQSLHLDSQTAAAHLRPGFVPVWGWGADEIAGDLVADFRSRLMFTLLMGLLAFVLCRAARFELVVCLLVAVLFVSLDPVDAFPRNALFLLLAAVAGLARLTPGAREAIRQRGWLRGLIGMGFLVLFLVALVPLVSFIQDRVFSALHPWAAGGGQVWADRYSAGFLTLGAAAAPGAMEMDRRARDEMEYRVKRSKAKLAELMEEELVGAKGEPRESVAQQVPSQWPAKAPPPDAVQLQQLLTAGPKEKSMRPVALDQPHMPGQVVSFTYRSVLPGQAATAKVLVAGNILRALWIFTEAFVLLLLLFLVAKGSHPLWRHSDPDEVLVAEVTS